MSTATPVTACAALAPALRTWLLRALQLPLALYIVGFASALLGSLALTYLVRERARRARLFDAHDERKIHEGEIPRVGGIAVFWAAALALGAVLLLSGGAAAEESGRGLAVVLLGALAIHAVGLYDDLRNIRARYKFLAQIGIAMAVWAAGLRVATLSLPFVGIVPLGTIPGLFFTLFWLVGLTNAFNLIDGLDGLASGAALFALTTMFVVANLNGQRGAALVTIVLAGATIGFLFYNFHPASIFLGDSGSLFLGFMLAGVGLLSSQKSQTVVAVAIPVVSLGLPVLDTLLSISRRFLRGQPIFTADRGHIHHRLLNLGHSPREAALLLYGGCALFALGGMLLVNDSGLVALVLVVIGLGVGLGIQRLRYFEFQELGRALRRGLRQRDLIGHNVRIREAGARVARLDSLDSVFDELTHVLDTEAFSRGEIRLRPTFLFGPTAVRALDRRLEDDLPVWTWSRSGEADLSLWEFKLPLLDGAGERVGSFVLWEHGTADDLALSKLHTVARELRPALQDRVLSLWHATEHEARLALEVTLSDEHVVPLPIVDETHRRRSDVGVTADGVGVVPWEGLDQPASGVRSQLS